MVQNPATPREPQAQQPNTATETFGHGILVGTPVARWIPIFALGFEKGRDEVESTVLTSVRALRQAVGPNAAHALRGDHYGAYQLVHCRCRTAPRTATNSTWLHFTDAEQARAFVTDFPDVIREATEQRS